MMRFVWHYRASLGVDSWFVDVNSARANGTEPHILTLDWSSYANAQQTLAVLVLYFARIRPSDKLVAYYEFVYYNRKLMLPSTTAASKSEQNATVYYNREK